MVEYVEAVHSVAGRCCCKYTYIHSWFPQPRFHLICTASTSRTTTWTYDMRELGNLVIPFHYWSVEPSAVKGGTRIPPIEYEGAALFHAGLTWAS